MYIQKHNISFLRLMFSVSASHAVVEVLTRPGHTIIILLILSTQIVSTINFCRF